jgi:hypothetical protein
MYKRLLARLSGRAAAAQEEPMSDHVAPAQTSITDPVTRRRIGIVLLALVVTAIIAVPAGMLWPDSSTGSDTYAYGDIQPVRDLWWGLLLILAALLTVNVPAQAIATTVLVKSRGSAWATWGAGLMWIGAGLQGVGVAFMAGAYFFPTDSSVGRRTGTDVFEAIAGDQAHLLGVLIPGALMVIVGTVLQAVALFRSHEVPIWVPIATLFAVLTFVVPGNGVVGLVTSLPMTAGAVGLAYYAWREVSPA